MISVEPRLRTAGDRTASSILTLPNKEQGRAGGNLILESEGTMEIPFRFGGRTSGLGRQLAFERYPIFPYDRTRKIFPFSYYTQLHYLLFQSLRDTFH
jgi:hypothetical protein